MWDGYFQGCVVSTTQYEVQKKESGTLIRTLVCFEERLQFVVCTTTTIFDVTMMRCRDCKD